MNIELWCIGKTQFEYVMNGVEEFKGRIKHYSSFNTIYIEGYRQNPGDNPQIVKDKEADNILKKLDSRDYLILLDEKGIEMNSVEFAGFIEKKMIHGSKTIIFLIGGAFGFSQKIYERANEKISLSKMTFSHQLIRLIFTEQLYRAFTIIKNEKYHNS